VAPEATPAAPDAALVAPSAALTPADAAPATIISLAVLILGSTLLAIAVIAAVLGARARRQFLPGPWRYTLAVPRPTRPVLPRIAVEYAAADLSWLGSETEADIDLPRSVAATVANSGFATLVHRRGPAPPHYMVLEDTAGGAERWRFLYDEILQGLAGEGVEVQRYTFAGNLDRCTAPDGHAVAFGALLDRTEALIAIGDGDAAVNALTGERAHSTSGLNTRTPCFDPSSSLPSVPPCSPHSSRHAGTTRRHYPDGDYRAVTLLHPLAAPASHAFWKRVAALAASLVTPVPFA
jgi:hypothetical protein